MQASAAVDALDKERLARQTAVEGQQRAEQHLREAVSSSEELQRQLVSETHDCKALQASLAQLQQELTTQKVPTALLSTLFRAPLKMEMDLDRCILASRVLSSQSTPPFPCPSSSAFCFFDLFWAQLRLRTAASAS